jgi:hypothetical protein
MVRVHPISTSRIQSAAFLSYRRNISTINSYTIREDFRAMNIRSTVITETHKRKIGRDKNVMPSETTVERHVLGIYVT